MFLLPNGNYINFNQPFELNELQYSADWLRFASPEERLAVSIIEVIDTGVKKSDKFYFTSEELVNGERIITNIPRDLNQCKTTLINEYTTTKQSLLSQTDWEIVASVDPSRLEPRLVSTSTTIFRQAIFTEHNQLLEQISKSSSIDDLEKITPNWPILASSIPH